MGAGESVLPQGSAPREKVLDLSRKVSHAAFMKHMEGEQSIDGLTEFPYELRESITLYEEINASFNYITYIPEEIPLRIPHLTKLVLSHNKINSLPETFLLFFHLRELDLDHNHMTSIPKPLTQLLTLEKLDLSHNAIEEVPCQLENMQSLTRLNLSYNKLTNVAVQSLAVCPLKVLLLHNNELSKPPQSVCDEGSTETLTWIRSVSALDHTSHVNQLLEFPRVRGSNILISSHNPSSVHLQYTQLQIFPDRVKTPLIPPSDSSKLQASDLKDRIVGLVYGAAIGDALSIGTEYLTADQCQFYYDDSYTYSHIIRDEYRTRWRKGDWSTQFDQMMIVLDSLLQWAGVVDELEFSKRLSQWCSEGFSELGDRKGAKFSETINQVVNDEQFLVDPHKTAEKYSSYENDDTALVRSLILGIPFFHNLEEVMSNSSRICRTTHADSMNVTASALLSGIVSLILQGDLDGTDPVMLISQSFSLAKKYLTTSKEETKFSELLKLNISSELRSRRNNTAKSLCQALQTLTWLKDFRSVMLKTLMRGQDCKVTATITGALHGALSGYSALPRDWLTQLPPKQTVWLNSKINHLLDLMAIP